jgi:predicted ATPase
MILGEAEPQTVAAAMATFLGRAAERSPRLVAVDDLHWLEADSAHVIEFAVRR